ncbi:MAG: hypothetical protein P8J20_02335 [Novosphingobium sp.]|nr:hypothetical protein [Novosphingobium sp.]
MRTVLLLAGAALALTSVWAVAQSGPESLLPPGFDNPPPAPAPAPTVSRPASSGSVPRSTSGPVVQPVPQAGGVSVPSAESAAQKAALLARLPTLEELEDMTPDEFEEILDLKPKFDIPPAARRSMEQVGIISTDEGGFGGDSLVGVRSSLVRAALSKNRGRLVSRWGHILLRRALTSRLDAPEGMEPVDFVALRVGLLLRMGEADAARALVQDVDTGNFSLALTNLALDTYIANADFTGICPTMATRGSLRDDPQWEAAQSICLAYRGSGEAAMQRLDKALDNRKLARVDLLLAQKYAGAAGRVRRAVTIEWDKVKDMTPWRYGLATAVGMEVPDQLLAGAGSYYDKTTSLAPAASLARRADAADRTAGLGILSSSAMIDLYSQIYSDPEVSGQSADRAVLLRDAYIAADPQDRFAAVEELWGDGDRLERYSRQVLTAFAAARLPVDSGSQDQAFGLITSMLAAGLDQNAMRWAEAVPAGSDAWALLVLAAPRRSSPVPADSLDGFIDDDVSNELRKSAYLIAGLAGLGRIDTESIAQFSGRLELDLASQTRWMQLINAAADSNQPGLVVLLVGLGMQGGDWNAMSPRFLYTIVSALRRTGMEAEARMIAAEAVARS